MCPAKRQLSLRRAADVEEFERLAGEFLHAREAEHNLILGICSSLRAMRSAAPFTRMAGATRPLPPYFAVVLDGDQVVGAALRTPPHNLILSDMADDRVADAILEDLLSLSPDLTGVLGDKRRAEHFAERWTRETGRPHRLKPAERIFQLTAVIPPRTTTGHLRTATAGDRDVVAGWFAEFIREAMHEDASTAGAVTDVWLTTPGRTLYLWETAEPVSMCGAANRTPNGIRIGAVYTPPGLRGRGYASNCVAAASQAQLDAGLRYCFLYTDLANPTSNRIYRAMGYEPVCDVDEYRFDVPSA
jgi:predicted GNAT family acetyltransferase